jgi:hypothetical protein
MQDSVFFRVLLRHVLLYIEQTNFEFEAIKLFWSNSEIFIDV